MTQYLSRLLRRYLFLALSVAVALALILASSFLVQRWENSRTERAFRGIASDRFRAIEEQFRDELLRLNLLRATYVSSVEARRGSYVGFIEEFRATVRVAMMSDPAVKTIAFAQQVPGDERKSLTTTMRSNGQPTFRIVDRTATGGLVPAPNRTTYFPILAAEPSSQGVKIQGWDLWAVASFRSALEEAISTGRTTAVPAVPIISGTREPLGFWLFIALLNGSTSAEASLGAQKIAQGFMAMQVRVAGLVEHALTGLNPSGIDFLVYDSTNGGQKSLLYRYGSQTRSSDATSVVGPSAPAYQMSIPFDVGGRQWELVAQSTPQFVRAHTYYLSWAVLGAGLFSLAIMIAFVLWHLRKTRQVETIVAERTAELSQEVDEHKKTELSLTKAHDALKRRVETINRRSREMELLSEMGDLLQTCQGLTEAYDVVAQFGEQLFPTLAGSLFMFNESRRFLESAASWGEIGYGESVFPGEACWAIRRGRLHAVTGQREGLLCRHLGDVDRKKVAYYCLPLIAQGETVGMLHIQLIPEFPGGGVAEGDRDSMLNSDQQRRSLAAAMAEHAAMAFANLRLRDRLHQQSIRDPLTALYNRRYMEESVEREIHRAKRSGTSLGVIFLDVDHFKTFNDTYGHEAGDQVLKSAARLLQKSVRGEDIPCRFGGEEFVLILPGASLESSRQKAESLRQEVSRISIDYGGQALPQITISLGVAVLWQGESNGTVLLQAADEALYRAKKSGRNRVEVFRN